MSEYALPLGDGWRVWKWMILRGTGFPVDGVLRLAEPELGAAFDTLAAAEEVFRSASARAADRLQELTRSAPADGKRLGKAVKRLRAQQLPEPLDGYEPELAESRAAAAARDRARDEVDRAFAAARLRTGAVLREVASDPRFREAVLWQSRGALRGSIDAFLRQPPGAADDKARQQEQLVAGYWQRYCTKNDTIGFFGPIGFAEWASGPGALACSPGPALLDRRQLFFEYWPIDALAETLSADPQLKPHLKPRMLPTVRLDGNTVHYPVDRAAELPEEFARALSLADGNRTARQIAAALAEDGLDEEDALDLLAQLESKRLLRWVLEVPTHTQHPERLLRELLESIADAEARARGLAALDELEAARARVAAAAGDAAALDEALGAADETFTRLTGRAPSRKGGEARALLSEDCRRDLRLALRPRLLESVGPPLALVLESARWHTHRLAELFRVRLLDVYRRLRKDGAELDLLKLWEEAAPLFSDDIRKPSPLVLEVRREFQARWAELLMPDPSRARIEVQSHALRERVAAAFAAPGPGWPNARFHSPDLLISAESVEAVERGDAWFVLGELHAAMHTVAKPVFLTMHPEADELRRAIALDVPEHVEPVKLRGTVQRRGSWSSCPDDVDVETSTARSRRPPGKVLRVADLVAEERDGRVWVRTRDGVRWFDALAFFGFNLTQTLGELHFLPPAPHTPRVAIDRLVLVRERWQLAPDEAVFARAPSPLERLAQARAWQRKHGLPRFVFVKVPEETKPIYVDFEAPVLVEALARLARKASSLSVTEMLPGPTECWLHDAEARRYACELRTTVVDPRAWTA